MKIMERHIQTIQVGQGEAYRDSEKRWAALEGEIGGFPPKRHYSSIWGEPLGTVVWQRDWESLAAMEAAYDKMMQSPTARGLVEGTYAIVSSERVELYRVMDE
jgi:hypothetical protein